MTLGKGEDNGNWKKKH